MGTDYWKLTKDFKEGMSVQKFFPTYDGLSPFVGRVTAVHQGLGCIDVQWPHGNERVFSDELVIVNPSIMRFLPPTLDQSYLTYDVNKARKEASVSPKLWRTVEVSPGFHKDLAQLWTKGAKEIQTYDELWYRYASITPDDVIRDEVTKFYLVAQNLAALRLTQHAVKSAAYWAAQNRQYRVTSQEVASRKPACPKCGTAMKKTTYKMHKGDRVRLFACPKDLFLLRQDDLLAPDGAAVVW